MPKKRRIVIDWTEYSDSELSMDNESTVNSPPAKRRKTTDSTTQQQPTQIDPTTNPPPLMMGSSNPAPAANPTDAMDVDGGNRENPTFPATDFDQLSSNKEHYWRFLGNANRAAAALFEIDEKGNTLATQYPPPRGLSGEETPAIRPLQNIQRSFKYGQEVFLANTPNGTPMSARRFYAGEFGEKDPKPFEIGIFSPTNAKTFWGGGANTVDLLSDKLDEKVKEELAEEFEEIETVFKGRNAEIDNPSVAERDGHKKRPISQNEVMARHLGIKNDKGKADYSAKTHYEDFLNEYEDILGKEIIERLKKSIEAAFSGFKSQPRPEWLHAVGYTLTSMKDDPQQADNLGASPKWANTMMMILEKIAKWFAMNRPESRIHIKPLFEMLLDSDIIHKLFLEVDVKYNNEYLRMFMDIHPFKKWPLYPKAYDMAFTTYYAHEKLSNATPLSEQLVTGAARKQRPPTELRPSYEELAEEWARHKNQLKHAIGEEAALAEIAKLEEDDPKAKEERAKKVKTMASDHKRPHELGKDQPSKKLKMMSDDVEDEQIEPRKTQTGKEKLETHKVLAELDKMLFGSYSSRGNSFESTLSADEKPSKKRRYIIEDSDSEDEAMDVATDNEMPDAADNEDMVLESLEEENPPPRRSKRLKRLRQG